MSVRAPAWIAWSLVCLTGVMFIAGFALFGLARAAEAPSGWSTSLTWSGLLVSVPFLAFPVVGALIVSKRPRNLVGWICLADGFLWMLLALIDYYGLAWRSPARSRSRWQSTR